MRYHGPTPHQHLLSMGSCCGNIQVDVKLSGVILDPFHGVEAILQAPEISGGFAFGAER